MKKNKRLAWVSGAMAALALALGASTAGAYNLYTEPGTSCQPYWRDAETIHSRSISGRQYNSAGSTRYLACPVQVDWAFNNVTTVYATVYASSGVGCYLAKNSGESTVYSPMDYNDGPGNGYVTTQLNGTDLTLNAWQLICRVPNGGHIAKYSIATHE